MAGSAPADSCSARLSVDPVTSDGLQLLQKFQEKDSVQFNDFVAAWSELNFPFVFWSGQDRVQKAGVVERLFCVGVQEMCQSSAKSEEPETYQRSGLTLRDSIAGLFLLYSVYFMQPCQPKVLIRVTPSNWEKIWPLHEQIQANQCFDADYALSRLRSSGAFVITCTDKTMCLSEQSGGQASSSYVPAGERSLGPVIETITDGMRAYHDMKLELSDYLPQHLLTTPTVNDQMRDALESYGRSLFSEERR